MNFKKVICDIDNIFFNKGDVYTVLFETSHSYFIIKYKSHFTLNPLYTIPLWSDKKNFKTFEEWIDKIKNNKT